MVIALSLVFGFRPQVIPNLDLSSFGITEDELKFTEAFCKGYSAKQEPMRRLGYPFQNWPGLKLLLESY